jgi:polyphosphate kinase
MDSFKPSHRLNALLLNPEQPFIHRDLSWLQFNLRVLEEAKLKSNPLLERVKFLSITSSNLDEFFMIRMAALGRSISTEFRRGDKKQLMRLHRIRSHILNSVRFFVDEQAEILDSLKKELKGAGIHIVTDVRESDRVFQLSQRVFGEFVLPELSLPEPLSATARIPHLTNLQIGALFGKDAFLAIPKKIKQAFSGKIEDQIYIFFLDHLLEAHLGAAFSYNEPPFLVRLTRDADMSVDLGETDPESMPDAVLTNLSKRDLGRPVRLQHKGAADAPMLATLEKTLRLSTQQLFATPRSLCLHGLWAVTNDVPSELRSSSQLTYKPLPPSVPAEFHAKQNIFDVLKERDFLLHHPYDSFDAYVNWIQMACDDPNTTMIQQTVYRMDALSPVIEALKLAAKRGKRVRVVIELRARFDEVNNLRLTDDLRNAGVEVAFGFGKLKLHAKVALVARDENGVTKLYTHLSTGNYNSVTARQYTDLAILTVNPEIGEDALHFFDSICRSHVPQTFKKLVPAPMKLHRKILHLIESEIAAAANGKPARIVAKVNTLVDHAVIEKLYQASNTGVKIDLIVRGACSLIPGIKGLSENIRVFSIVDRFLEHSRIYYFESTNALYLSSADWMPRNFFSRLELAFPILDQRIHSYIAQVLLPTYLSDRVKAWELSSSGTWHKRSSPASKELKIRSQFYFAELAERSYHGTPLEELPGPWIAKS